MALGGIQGHQYPSINNDMWSTWAKTHTFCFAVSQVKSSLNSRIKMLFYITRPTYHLHNDAEEYHF